MKKLNGTVIVTYRCNARCNMCNRYKKPSLPQEEISLDVIRKTASEMISDIDGALEEIHLVNSRDKNTKISVLTNLHDKQERIRKESDRSSLSFTKTKNNQDYVKESRKDIQL